MKNVKIPEKKDNPSQKEKRHQRVVPSTDGWQIRKRSFDVPKLFLASRVQHVHQRVLSLDDALLSIQI
jgi:hypothetical protein